MANEDNLIPFNERTESEHREIARSGGIASGESRRERKTLREHLLIYLSTGDTQDEILRALVDRARKGDIGAFKVIRDTIGEKSAEPKFEGNPLSLEAVAEMDKIILGVIKTDIRAEDDLDSNMDQIGCEAFHNQGDNQTDYHPD